ncbi:MAG: alpha/beta hydrolase [Dehalococcoidia bacterium]
MPGENTTASAAAAGAMPRRALRLPPMEEVPVVAGDGAELRLTHFPGGPKGPVLLAPGFGTSRKAFLLDTVEENFPEALVASGYDVWIFEYRSSPELAASKTQFTLDDIATYDWPAAIDAVRQATGGKELQVVAHCVGSMTFLMAMALGMTGVRSAICSQLTLHAETSQVNKVKARARLAELLSMARLKSFTTDSRKGNVIDQSVDRALWLHPGQQRCSNATCRRITLLYGDVFAHGMLNDQTHETLGEMFGAVPMSAMRHIATIARAGRAVDVKGRDVYLPHLDRLAIPITFIHGERNNLFLPRGSAATYKALCEANGEDLYRRHIFGGYAHMDCFVGARSNRDIFPLLVDELDRFNPAPEKQP